MRPRGRGATRDRRIDLGGQLLTPGFIAGHGHAISKVTRRGIAEMRVSDGDIAEPALDAVVNDTLSDSELELLVRFSLAENTRAGVTISGELSDTKREFDIFVRVAHDWGVRTYPTISINGVSDEEVTNYVQDMKAVDGGGLTTPMFGIGWPADPTAAQRLVAGAKKLGTGIQIHIAQNNSVVADTKKKYGLTPVQWLDQQGIFSTGLPVFGYHLTCSDPKTDFPILSKYSHFIYAHDPSAAYGGQQPFPEALAYGVNTGIGYGARSGDYIMSLTDAVDYGIVRWLNRTPDSAQMIQPTPMHVLQSATVNQTRALGRPDLGRIEVGATADITSTRIQGLQLGLAGPNPENNLLYSAGRDVQFVMTNGTVLVRNGDLTFANADKVVAKARGVMTKVWAALVKSGRLPN